MIGSVMDAAQLENATGRCWATMERHKLYVSEPGEDMPEVRNWLREDQLQGRQSARPIAFTMARKKACENQTGVVAWSLSLRDMVY